MAPYTPSKLEIHYFLKDCSHSMDAIVRNKCEAEFLAIAYELIEELGFDITLNAEALKEGGIRDVWNFLGRNNAQIALIISVISLVYSLYPKTDSELISLQKEDLRLSIKERELIISKLSKELYHDKVTQDSVESVVKLANHNYKIITRRSNFYKTLSKYENVEQIGISTLNNHNRYITKEQVVPQKDFSQFVLPTHKLKAITDEDAVIEIVAPVLRNGKTKWRGIYQNEPISFSMNDSIFKGEVLAGSIAFDSGSAIKCILEIERELNELGEIIVSKYKVLRVLDRIDSGNIKETLSGKHYRYQKKFDNSQDDLFKSNQ